MSKVSVIIPIYNASEFLDVTLSCFLYQDYDNYEVLAVNDMSTDSSELIVEKYIPLYEEKGKSLKLIKRQKNGGLCAAINSGIEAATGEFFCFPDADDEVSSKYISSMVKEMIKQNRDWVRCDYEIVLEDEEREYEVILPRISVYKDDFFDFISKYVAHNAWNMVVKRSYFEKCIGGKIHDSRLTQEWSLLLPLSYTSNYARCEEKLYRYHIRKKAMSSWQNGEMNDVIQHIDDLEKLNHDVLNEICSGMESDRIRVAKTALSAYYSAFRYKVYARNNSYLLADREKERLFDIGRKYLSPYVERFIVSPDIYNRLLLDKILGARLDELRKRYLLYKKYVCNGYSIVFDQGGKLILQEIVNIFGRASLISSYEEYDNFLDTEKVVVCLIQNSKLYSCFKDKHGDKQCIEFREVRDSIRGWSCADEKYME